MKKRAISLLLAFVMLFSLLPVQAFAAEEPEYLPEAEIDERYVSDGAFYFASAGAELYENAGHGYLLKVARWGLGEEAASVRLTMTDLTAGFGKDYTASLYDSALFEGGVKNSGKSESVLEFLQGNDLEEYNYSDAVVDGTITAEDQLTDEELDGVELTEDQKAEIESASTELMAALAGTTPAEAETQANEAAPAEVHTGNALSAAREKATGLADDREPVTYDVPAASDDELFSDSGAYMLDSIAEVSDALNSAYIVIDFDAGETEHYIEICPLNNSKSDGNRQSNFALESENDSKVSGMYSSFTLKLIDDEPYVPDVIEFSDTVYYPEDGYVTVTVQRTGNLTGVLTAMLDTEDDTAVGGLDYSQVHAKLAFGFGISERKVKIPVRSDYLTSDVRFKIALSDPQECAIGSNSTAYCVIRKGDTSFQSAASKSDALGAGALTATQDMNLNTVIVGEKFHLSEIFTSSFLTRDKCRSEPYGEDGWLLYAHKHGDNAYATAIFDFDVWHYDYSGYEVYWSRKAGKPTYGSTKFWSGNGTTVDVLYNKSTERWTNDTDRYYLSSPASNSFEFQLYAKTDVLATNPTLEIYYVKPILRPFKIQLMGAEPFELIDNNGNRVKNTETTAYASENEVMLLNSDSSDSLVTTTGSSITVELRNNASPIAYISGLYLVNTDTNEKVLIKSYPVGTTSASLEITNDLIRRNVKYVCFKSNDKHGLYGNFAIQPIVSNMPATVRVQKHDNAEITVWDESVITPVSSDAKETVYDCSVGDILRYNVKLADSDSEVYEWDRMTIETLRPAGQQKYDIYRQTNKDYAQDDVGGTEIRVSPVVTTVKNQVIVRVKQSEKDLFDTAYGIFANPAEYNGAYLDYTIDTQKVAGKNYELSAKAKDSAYVPVWYVANKTSVKFSQDTFYFTGAAQPNDNIIYLSLAKADSTPYSIAGTVYYDDAALGGAVSAEAWYPASGAYYIVDSAHYGIADMDGQVRTIPAHGIAGDYVRFKIAAAGYTDYSDVLLKQQNVRTEEFDSPEGNPYTVSYYELDLANRVISATNMQRPHIKSITARSARSEVSSTSVKISNEPVSFIITVETTDPATGLPYTYTYTDENGVEQTRTETPVAVDLIICDPVTHEQKYVITGAKASGSGSGSSWQLSYTFTHDEYTKYKAGDIIYVRLTTDRFVGDGCAENEAGERIPVDALRQTAYAPVRSKFALSGVNPQEPQVIDINIDPTNHIPQAGNYYNLPLIGELTMMINACGLSFGVAETETGGLRLFFGKQIMSLTTNSHFDGYGNPVSDTGFAIDSDNIASSFHEMADMVNTLGDVNKLHAMSLGIPAWSFEPMAGIYLEFAVYNDNVSDNQQRLEFVGGGGYIGAIGNFRYTYYMVFYGIPVYVGGDVSVSLVAELGIAADQDQHIFFSDPDQDLIDEVINNSHFQFLFRAMITANAYAGIGICGTLGVRGGFTLILKFIANPMVTKSYPSVRSSGFAVTGTVKFWADIVLLSVPIPVYSWDLLKLGYFKDIAELKEDNPGSLLAPSSSSQPIYSKPRSTGESDFVGDKKVLQSTFDAISSRNIVKNSYDDSQQKLIQLSGGRILMVYLDDDKTRDDNERTALKYTIYDDGVWSTPIVIQDDGTADFSPNVCDAGDDVIITWVSRPEDADPEEYRDYLSANEIYVVRMDKDNQTLGTIERLTNDDYYDTDPVAIYDSNSDDVLVIYSKSEVGAINDSADLMNAALPYTNGSVLMYMLYDGGSGEWVRDKFFENEIANPEDAQSLLDEFDGQRFVPTAAFGMTNPAISDLTSDSCIITNLNAEDLEAFDERYAQDHDITYGELSDGGVMPSDEEIQEYLEAVENFKREWTKPYGLYAYTVDKDNNLSTDSDREVFVQLYDFETHKTWESIQITNNEENDSSPQLIHVGDTAYLFWLHDGKEIRYINATDTMCEADSEGFVRYRTVTAKTADTDIDDLSISSFKAFADNDQNLFVAWQQNSATISEENTELIPTQDIYLAGYVKYSDGTQSYSSWSDAIRMTDNGKLNNLPEFTDLGGGRLMMVNSQYSIDMNGDIYAISNVNLVETDYATVGSLKVVDVKASSIPKNSGDEFYVDIKVRNDGVKSEPGFEYSIALMAGGKPVQEFNGTTVNTSVPAGQTVTVTQKFTLPDDAADYLDILNIKMNIKEDGTDKPVLSGAPLFDGKPRYELTDIKAVQEGNRFCISGIARNVGSGKCDSTDTIDIYADGSDAVLASATLSADADINMAVPFSVVVDIDSEAAKYGFVNYALVARAADGSARSSIETLRAALVNPFNLCLNGSNSDEITISKGQSLSLSTTYEPTTFYRNANVKYAVDDARVATINDNCLVGLEEGETILRMTVDPYGGSKTVNVIVTDDSHDFDDDKYEIEFSPNIRNGKVEVSPKNASAGQTVTITVTPDKGFTLETLTVLDESGKEIEVKTLGSNKYSFKMPSGKVTVEATFMEDNTMLNFFVDVPATEYYYDAVLWAAENGVTNGTDAVHFSPNAPVTRAQVVTFLWRAAGCPEPTGNASKFVDVPADAYYAKAVAWAIEQGITKGTSTMTFTPDAVCTRGQIVTFLARFAGVEDADTESVFSDVKSTDYFAAAVKWAKDNGVTEGTSATMFSPNNNCTRAQAVTFLYRWMVK